MSDKRRREFWIEPEVRDTRLSEVLSFDPNKEYNATHYKHIHAVELQPHERIFSREQVIDLLHDRLESYSLLECTEIADILFGNELFATGEK